MNRRSGARVTRGRVSWALRWWKLFAVLSVAIWGEAVDAAPEDTAPSESPFSVPRYHSSIRGWGAGVVSKSPSTNGRVRRGAWSAGGSATPDASPTGALSEPCLLCHARAPTAGPEPAWRTRSLTFPRDAYCTHCHERPDGEGLRPGAGEPPAGHPPLSSLPRRPLPGGGAPGSSMADPFRLHDRAPRIAGASARVRRGEKLYQRNCAFCHAADGTGRSWYGNFLEPPPRDLTDPSAMAGIGRAGLVAAIQDGVEGTSMPAWGGVLTAKEIEALVAYIDRAFLPVAGLAANRGAAAAAR